MQRMLTRHALEIAPTTSFPDRGNECGVSVRQKSWIIVVSASLKPFVFKLNDLALSQEQVNFVPVFDAQTNGKVIVAFDRTVDAYSSTGVLLWNAATQTVTRAGLDLGSTDPASLGTSFPHATSAIGVRDPSGHYETCFDPRRSSPDSSFRKATS